MDPLHKKALAGLLLLFLAMAAALFIPAGTLDYWQAWIFLAVYFAASAALSLHLMQNDQALMERRMRGGPLAEKEPTQRIIMSIVSLGFVGLLVVPAFDRRCGWSEMPPHLALAVDGLVVLGWLAIFFVFRENSFTSATVELAPDQRVISTGPYARVRHPMYAGLLSCSSAFRSRWARGGGARRRCSPAGAHMATARRGEIPGKESAGLRRLPEQGSLPPDNGALVAWRDLPARRAQVI